ncbi:MAG: primosomal protein N', partial [Candidatus Subteraquimicrobiales bacterium]|nr:primosomal protein N' [Candidatus Subteraquimicrobiales bacterium]
WIADYYLSTSGEALKLVMPPGRGRKLSSILSLNASLDLSLEKISKNAFSQIEILKFIWQAGGKCKSSQLKAAFGKGISSLLKILEDKNLITRRYVTSEPTVDVKQEKWAKLIISPEKAREIAFVLSVKAPRQQKVLESLSEGEMPLHELLALVGVSYSTVTSLVKKGYIKLYDHATFREPDFYYPETVSLGLTLTSEQQTASDAIIEALNNRANKTFLLKGVTGSGKTEVYLRAIEHALKLNKTAIVLVPEIALTPQTVHRFRARFGEIVAVLHSGLGIGERYDQWRKIKEGKLKVVVGARSAIFAPLEDLRLIVLDEEHETTYKQNRNPRYHTREIAFKLAELSKATVILGSATPSIETKFRVEKGEFIELSLTRRIDNKPLPAVEIVDMREEIKKGKGTIFSESLLEQLKTTLEAGEKAILFLNRRGFASFLMCRDCGFSFKCTRCTVTLTYHMDKSLLLCHHCGYATSASKLCPNCQSHHVGYFGVGTQKVESEIKKLFPEIPVVRMDADTTTYRDAHRKRLIEFKKLDKAILLGTQMIAKGLDFPEVTFVGVINADVALNIPDFRSAERTFQLLMQVSGRAGRGEKPGKVIIQTYSPEFYAIQAAFKSDYDSFYAKEIIYREELFYPPYSQLINVVVSSSDELRAKKVALNLSQLILEDEVNGLISLIGPAPCPIPKIMKKFRWHLILKVKDDGVKYILREKINQLIPAKALWDATIIVDVDPVWLL